jgi:hypothetical protein
MSDSHVKSGFAEVGHTHADVSGGALRASVFGGMDGLVTNIALVAGVGAAGASADFIVLTGLAGLVAGAFSMAMGEFTSVKTQNEQVDRDVAALLRPRMRQADCFTSTTAPRRRGSPPRQGPRTCS